jgi:hypothetical protein
VMVRQNFITMGQVPGLKSLYRRNRRRR